MDIEMVGNAFVIFCLALLFAGIGVKGYFYYKRQHIKQVIQMAKED